ncbi:MAG: L-histidine N(alpha)-methyltransferase [Rhodomicrobium sp.]
MQLFSGLETAPRIADSEFLEAVLHGLALPQKALPCRFFYDEAGSELFERITKLPEYYPTRTEIALLRCCAPGLKEALPPGAAVVEFGSGSSWKTGLLLEALDRPAAYIPIEISAAALYPAAQRIQQEFPNVAVHPILGGFHDLSAIKLPFRGCPRVGFFPGSTIGNMTHDEAAAFLRFARNFLGAEALFIVGADLQKPLSVLLPAYDDAQGVTAAFNRNILVRINRELNGTFNLSRFEHRAVYNEAQGRVEMHLRAGRPHRVSVAGRTFQFRQGETIHTENSYKYTVRGFHAIARRGGWLAAKSWTDKDRLFSLHLLA